LWTGLLAFLLTTVGGGIWTAMLVANLSTTPAIPWSVAAMAIVLWAIWSYLSGKGPPATTSDARRRYLRARRISAQPFLWALLAGVLSVIALAGLWIVIFRAASMPSNSLPDFSRYPPVTVALILAMASVVTSAFEKAGFRGYFLGPLESRVTAPLAILIQSLVIAPAHSLTQGFVWPTMLFYFLVDTMLGTSAYLTNSIVPGILVHAFGLLVSSASSGLRIIGEFRFQSAVPINGFGFTLHKQSLWRALHRRLRTSCEVDEIQSDRTA
jgi:membrane protease YdiL (CAAX protease family)